MGKCGALGVWICGDGKGELLNFQLNNSREYYTAWDDHYVDVNFTGWRYFELLLRERDAQRHQDYVWPYGGACEVGRSPISAQPGRGPQCLLQQSAPERRGALLLRPGEGLARGEGQDRATRPWSSAASGSCFRHSRERPVHRV